MFKTILLTGANGLLGQKLVNRLSRRESITLIATSKGANRNPGYEGYIYESLDINDAEKWEELYEKYEPDEIIHTAAMTNVDQCESEREECWKQNVEALDLITNLCLKYGTRLIHVSTDFIFDGEAGPYNERAEGHPLSYYGQSKLKGEEIILESGINAAIVRAILIYGMVPHMSRSNIVLWAKGALEKQQPIKVVNDQFRSPTLAEDLADGILLVSMKNKSGIWHISGPEVMSILEIVQQVADFWGLDKSLITETDSSSLAQAAKRPPKTGFIILKAQTELGFKPHTFREGLAILDRQLGDK
jgi:dTDP-4-dehydrorhamnose reductase